MKRRYLGHFEAPGTILLSFDQDDVREGGSKRTWASLDSTRRLWVARLWGGSWSKEGGEQVGHCSEVREMEFRWCLTSIIANIPKDRIKTIGEMFGAL